MCRLDDRVPVAALFFVPSVCSIAHGPTPGDAGSPTSEADVVAVAVKQMKMVRADFCRPVADV